MASLKNAIEKGNKGNENIYVPGMLHSLNVFLFVIFLRELCVDFLFKYCPNWTTQYKNQLM